VLGAIGGRGFSATGEGLEKLLEAERAQLPPWFVVAFGARIAAWIALHSPAEWKAFLCITTGLCTGDALRPGGAGSPLGL